MEKKLSTFYIILFLLNYRKIPIFSRIFFILRYSFDILKVILFKPKIKQVYFLNGEKFSYFGIHTNLLLDNVILHLKSYCRYYKNAGVVFDVGASFGTFSLMINYLNKKSHIYCFEPEKESFRLLEKNTAHIKNIYLFNNAIGDMNKKVSVHFNQIYPEGSTVEKYQSKKVNSIIQQITLDDFIKVNKIYKISLIKIDTEGYETLVLKGAIKTLSITEYVIVEANYLNLNNFIDLLKLLKNQKFKMLDIALINNNLLDLVFKKNN